MASNYNIGSQTAERNVPTPCSEETSNVSMDVDNRLFRNSGSRPEKRQASGGQGKQAANTSLSELAAFGLITIANKPMARTSFVTPADVEDAPQDEKGVEFNTPSPKRKIGYFATTPVKNRRQRMTQRPGLVRRRLNFDMYEQDLLQQGYIITGTIGREINEEQFRMRRKDNVRFLFRDRIARDLSVCKVRRKLIFE